MLDAIEPAELTVIANTGDDIEIYGAHVSPDPDLVSFWLADRIDDRGWGLDGDTFNVMDGLREIGEDVWFNLGDRDLAIGIQRAQALRAGTRLTDAHRALTNSLGIAAAVLPMTDQPVRTRVLTDDGWVGLQAFLIRLRGAAPIREVRFAGAPAAAPTPEVLAAIAGADAIVIGPSNPVISIGPILAVPGLPEALAAARAPVLAVSPIVAGAVLKGPTAAFMAHAGRPLTAAGVADLYGTLLDGIVSDERVDAIPALVTDTAMPDAGGRARVAGETLRFALALG